MALWSPALAAEAVDQADETNTQPPNDRWMVQGQATLVWQGHAGFRSPYQGANSLNPRPSGRETLDFTLYAGVRPWRGAEIWINPEVDQGGGLSGVNGVAGFPSGEAFKADRSTPTARIQRLFLRQTIDLGGKRQKVAPDLNQFAGEQGADRLVLTLGKFAVTDVFDANGDAHDARQDFLNWSIVDTGAFDYAADAWGFSQGAAAELYRGRSTFRLGVFQLARSPSDSTLGAGFKQVQGVAEVEWRYDLKGRPGTLRATGFLSRGPMGRFDDAVDLARQTGDPADIAAVRRDRNRGGVGFNIEQQIAPDIGVFVRAGLADGEVESYSYTDIDRTLAAGLAVTGERWGRSDDVVGVALALNGASRARQDFLDAGGLGLLVGDGRLPRPGVEQVTEAYYNFALTSRTRLSFDLQMIRNPGFNRDRGPVALGALRLHTRF